MVRIVKLKNSDETSSYTFDRTKTTTAHGGQHDKSEKFEINQNKTKYTKVGTKERGYDKRWVGIENYSFEVVENFR